MAEGLIGGVIGPRDFGVSGAMEQKTGLSGGV